ncbi:hypothetical protein HHK36_001441 [Tetracentron sinense]|uniref:BTB domain-containing protein n=1 Tax=Tetracentron sinense TaxID=13715 RepID=A0A834ZTG3_TETSI|nr:hypothetical protein HHK36_001441 [Tetracentron sinense]
MSRPCLILVLGFGPYSLMFGCWNVRGLNNGVRQRDVRDFVKANKLHLVSLVETKVQEVNADRIMSKCTRHWQRIDNYSHATNGRIWLLWDSLELNVQPLSISKQAIHVTVSCRDWTSDAIVSVVYGSNVRVEREDLWRELLAIAHNHNLPWMVSIEVTRLRTQMDQLEALIINNGDNANLHEELRLTRISLTRVLAIEEAELQQKSRVKWLNLGDKINEFFHQAIASRRHINRIDSILNQDGVLVSDTNQIPTIAVNFFSTLLSRVNCPPTMIEEDCFGSHLNQHELQALTAPFSSECYDSKGRKWQSTNIEIQRLAIRSISAFIDYISSDASQHLLLKDSIADMLVALEGILQSRNEAVLGMAANVTLKLVNILGNSMLRYPVLELVHPLSSSLSLRQSTSAVSCAIALNQILSKLPPSNIKRQKEVWKILKETNTLDNIVGVLQDFVIGTKPVKYFQEMASLLRTILWRWPPSRYPVWSNAKLMEQLGAICAKPDSSFEVSILQLYSALALCGNGAMKLLENGESLLPIIVRCMGSSQPHSVRMEGFKLAQYLAISEQGCLRMMRSCCEPIIRAILNAMGEWSLRSGKFASDQVSLLVEACRLALITRWAGDHHGYFWKLGVDRVLLDLLPNNFHKNKQSQHFLSLRELLATARQCIDANCLSVLRPYIWDILGWLATHCQDDFNPNIHGNEHCLNVLIACTCLVFVDSIHKGRQVYHNDPSYTSMCEPASRAVLMMIYSSCKYISSQARHILSEVLMPNGEEYLKFILDSLKSIATGDKFGMSDNLKTVINLMGLVCYSSFPKYRSLVLKNDGIRTLSTFIRECLNNYVDIGRLSIAPHLHDTCIERTCCWDYSEDWEGRNILLFFSLWGQAELIRHCSFVRNHSEVTSGQAIGIVELESSETQILLLRLKEICGTFGSGPKWYAAYILSCFGVYGFPNKLGKRIGKALNEKELADVNLILMGEECLRVHGVVLMVRCPSILPPGDLPLDDKKSVGSAAGEEDTGKLCRKFRRDVRLSAHVDHQALLKLLEFVYVGFIQVDNDLVKQLKMLVRRCNLQFLSHMLRGERPKWGTAIPCYDFTPALGPVGHHFSDIILEANATELVHLTCSVCSLLVPHMHVHKIILWSSCDYLQALFQSGMQESHSQTIKVPVGWEALVKLVSWFYSDELPKPSSGCLWDSMDIGQKLHELQPYIELCWLAEFWFLEDVREICLRVVLSCLKSSRHLSVKVIQMAANLSQWKLAEVAANYMAPLYPHLRDSGDLESLDDELVDMVRRAYVRLSQESGCDHSD